MMNKLIRLFRALLLRLNRTCDLAMENLALRQQLAVMKRSVKRAKLRRRDRLFWVLVSRFWGRWREAVLIVRPQTVVKWHRNGFKQ